MGSFASFPSIGPAQTASGQAMSGILFFLALAGKLGRMRTVKELVPAPKSLIAQVMCNSHHHSSAPRRRRRRRQVGGQAGSKLGTLCQGAPY